MSAGKWKGYGKAKGESKDAEVRAKMEGLSLTLQGRRWRVAAKEELEGQRLHRLRRKM